MQTPLLFYTARFQVRDAVFGFPIGSSINLVLPDGSAIRGRLGHASQIQVDWLPRGNYSVKAFGPGIPLTATVALSRVQDVKVLFLSYLDIAAVILVFLAFLVGLPVLGRRLVGLRRKLAPMVSEIAS